MVTVRILTQKTGGTEYDGEVSEELALAGDALVCRGLRLLRAPAPLVAVAQRCRQLRPCRAKAVADGLVSQGLNATAVAVDWKGESAPAVATGDGVKEPLNRRSTVSINFQ